MSKIERLYSKTNSWLLYLLSIDYYFIGLFFTFIFSSLWFILLFFFCYISFILLWLKILFCFRIDLLFKYRYSLLILLLFKDIFFFISYKWVLFLLSILLFIYDNNVNFDNRISFYLKVFLYVYHYFHWIHMRQFNILERLFNDLST